MPRSGPKITRTSFTLYLEFFIKVTVESIDDVEEMQIMDEAFDILGFTHDEKFDVYRVTSSAMILSQLSDSFQGMGEVASPKTLDAGNRLNDLLHFAPSGEEIYDRFINPKFKVKGST